MDWPAVRAATLGLLPSVVAGALLLDYLDQRAADLLQLLLGAVILYGGTGAAAARTAAAAFQPAQLLPERGLRWPAQRPVRRLRTAPDLPVLPAAAAAGGDPRRADPGLHREFDDTHAVQPEPRAARCRALAAGGTGGAGAAGLAARRRRLTQRRDCADGCQPSPRLFCRGQASQGGNCGRPRFSTLAGIARVPRRAAIPARTIPATAFRTPAQLAGRLVSARSLPSYPCCAGVSPRGQP